MERLGQSFIELRAFPLVGGLAQELGEVGVAVCVRDRIEISEEVLVGGPVGRYWDEFVAGAHLLGVELREPSLARAAYAGKNDEASCLEAEVVATQCLLRDPQARGSDGCVYVFEAGLDV